MTEEFKANAEKHRPLYLAYKQEHNGLYGVNVDEGDVVWPLCTDVSGPILTQLLERLKTSDDNWKHTDE